MVCNKKYNILILLLLYIVFFLSSIINNIIIIKKKEEVRTSGVKQINLVEHQIVYHP